VLWIALFAFLAAPAEQKRLGAIDFFGYAGMDAESVRRALPFREGDPAGPASVNAWRDSARDAVLRVTGRPATDVATVCCDDAGGWMVYIGLPGASSVTPQYRPAATGAARLPREVTELDAEIGAAWGAAVMRGTAGEDHSTGFALSHDAALRAKQLQMRRLALRHQRRILQVLAGSADAGQRRAAASAAGYVRQNRAQVRALAAAASDPDDTVRNNAVRALMVLARARPSLRRLMPPDVFIGMVRSGTWTDRNKGAAVLLSLTEDGDAGLLAALRSQAAVALAEMARWKSSGHAGAARVLLERIETP
jgi:hypothetical protein